jgi:hypothetical protein
MQNLRELILPDLAKISILTNNNLGLDCVGQVILACPKIQTIQVSSFIEEVLVEMHVPFFDVLDIV